MLAAIDGACRRNGKPDCVSAGGVLIIEQSEHCIKALTASEVGSTNQRGELLALRELLKYLSTTLESDVQIITDSEYLFNSMSKEWIKKWAANNWCTASGTAVKNADIWKDIYTLYMKIEVLTDVVFYHIKGHVIPYGAVTAEKLLSVDSTGETLYQSVLEKYDTVSSAKRENLEHAQQLSERNNGFKFDQDTLRNFVAMNITADAIATKAVNEADCRAQVGSGQS